MLGIINNWPGLGLIRVLLALSRLAEGRTIIIMEAMSLYYLFFMYIQAV